MTPEAQRIAIAKACGIEVVSDGITHHLCRCTLGGKGYDPAGKFLCEVPDYLNDLNAMHEAEKILTETTIVEYADWLLVIANSASSTNQHWFLATAAQRAEAFLRTLNLWDDSK